MSWPVLSTHTPLGALGELPVMRIGNNLPRVPDAEPPQLPEIDPALQSLFEMLGYTLPKATTGPGAITHLSAD